MLAKKKFYVLDSWRGLAAFAIALFHFDTSWGGYLAVDFFLVLSGFILYHTYVAHDLDLSKSRFVFRRIARLYPLHVFTLFLYTACHLWVMGDIPRYAEGTIFTLSQHLTLTQGIGISPCGWNYPSWSISVEFWINVGFIFLISPKTKSAILVLISLAGLALIFWQTGHLDTHSTNYFTIVNSGLIRGLSSFLLGIVVYRLHEKMNSNQSQLSQVQILEWVFASLLLFVLFAREDKRSALDFTAPFVFGLIVLVFAFERGVLSKLLKPFKYLGTISYSIYLNQMAILLLVNHYLPEDTYATFVRLLVYLFILLMLSHFTFRFIELPARNFLKSALRG